MDRPMKKVIFLYRDASNYKCEVEKLFYAINFEEGDTVEFERVGIEDDDIPLIATYGRTEDDHNLLEVLTIKEV